MKKIVFVVVGCKDVSNFRVALATLIPVEWRVRAAHENDDDNAASGMTTVTIVRSN